MPKFELPEGKDWDEIAKDELISEGRHPARIDAVEERESQSTPGNMYWNITFTVTEGPHTGRQAWAVCMLDAKSLWKLRQLADAVGIDLGGRSDIDTEELLQQECGIVITHEEYEGRLRHRVSQFFPLGTTDEVPGS